MATPAAARPDPTAASDRPDPGPRLLRGVDLAAQVRETVAADVTAFSGAHGWVPDLAVVIVGRDAPSTVYLHKILAGCRLVGIGDRLVELPDDCTAATLSAELRALSRDPKVAGIIVQQPLPPGIPLRAVIDSLDPARDIDGIHPLNAGLLALGYEGFLPATAHAAVELLKQSGIPLVGRRAVVDGRVVGDVDFASAADVVSAIAPVPGGVGPLTNAILLTHLMRAARNLAEGRLDAGTSSLHPAPGILGAGG